MSDKDLRDRQAFLRRPFSIADQWTTRDGSVHLCVMARVVGTGTRWLAQLQPGDTLNLTGPLGRGFRIPPPDVPLVLLGGGVGIPPLIYLTRRLSELGRRDVTVIIGARTRELLPVRLIDKPDEDGRPCACVKYPGGGRFDTIVASDDGSVGMRGLVTDALRAWHERRPSRNQNAVVCACGPAGMLKAAAVLTRELGLACQLCIERNMGCGLGTCLSCVVRARDDKQPQGWRWALACSDGPVFERDDLLDYGPDVGV
ncbi:MAG: dihydroorotate dehydrogenase electron transfer subunit [Phycisphaerae bacterium]|nr:dihydroorotate dehydrogenase electron transfer subunit [Phycisphaerae bacterium]